MTKRLSNGVATFRPSATIKERVAGLIYKEKTEGLSPEETSELNHFMQLEHVMRLAKARIRKHLAHE